MISFGSTNSEANMARPTVHTSIENAKCKTFWRFSFLHPSDRRVPLVSVVTFPIRLGITLYCSHVKLEPAHMRLIAIIVIRVYTSPGTVASLLASAAATRLEPLPVDRFSSSRWTNRRLPHVGVNIGIELGIRTSFTAILCNPAPSLLLTPIF